MSAQEDKTHYINEIFEAQRRAQIAALEAAYIKQGAGFDAQQAHVPALYQAAKNATGADFETSRANLNESISASGLNTGAGGQRLSQSNLLQRNLSALDVQRALRMADIDMERGLSQKEYGLNISRAIGENEFDRAQALYKEAVRMEGVNAKSHGRAGAAPASEEKGKTPSSKAQSINTLLVPGYGELSYEDAEKLLNNDLLALTGRKKDGTPIFAQTTQKNYNTPLALTR